MNWRSWYAVYPQRPSGIDNTGGESHRVDFFNTYLTTAASCTLRYEADVVRRARGDGEFGNHQENSSYYASHVVLVKKKDSSNHICIKYRRLKKLTVSDAHPMIPLLTCSKA
ncbi:polyprotein of retroviral origin [Plakobranchus ocellatus]|uniref:Polyprotein of retroviral origin n=1 Tax=Plakobranchus ocellatus TaxID=259542 RepID=A0AAV4D053_9GAST|nr:polyprotein of retroviral origin [Plakobranchus ocellatus]